MERTTAAMLCWTAVGSAGGAHGDRGARPGTLEEWDVDLRESVHVLRAGISHVTRNADDLPLDGRPQPRYAGDQLLDGEAVFQRVASVEVSVHEPLVHDGHAERACAILGRECAAFDDLDTERPEVLGRDHREAGARTRARIDGFVADDGERHPEVGAGDRHANGVRRRNDTRHRPHSFERRGRRSRRSAPASSSRPMRDGQIEREKPFGPESKVDVRQLHQAVNRQAAAGQEAQGERKLDDDQRATQPVTPAAHGAPGFLQHLVHVRPRRLPRRRASEQHRRTIRTPPARTATPECSDARRLPTAA